MNSPPSLHSITEPSDREKTIEATIFAQEYFKAIWPSKTVPFPPRLSIKNLMVSKTSEVICEMLGKMFCLLSFPIWNVGGSDIPARRQWALSTYLPIADSNDLVREITPLEWTHVLGMLLQLSFVSLTGSHKAGRLALLPSGFTVRILSPPELWHYMKHFGPIPVINADTTVRLALRVIQPPILRCYPKPCDQKPFLLVISQPDEDGKVETSQMYDLEKVFLRAFKMMGKQIKSNTEGRSGTNALPKGLQEGSENTVTELAKHCGRGSIEGPGQDGPSHHNSRAPRTIPNGIKGPNVPRSLNNIEPDPERFFLNDIDPGWKNYIL
ncbi:hypothetical protein CPB84DRAFT_1790191 [Gymnopilus junonius]|uniref:Uncharacterized protein n=1 Tax=Gymnopilus junonius TaxID=109634 RepID=A0A9P5TJB6_GYMJU|nr:hypothetical protein CPB84DRAFT_1790191 [Gymnopilus junonius]